MRRFFVLVCFLLSVTHSGFAADNSWQSELLRDHPLVGKIYDVTNRSFVTYAVLLTRLKSEQHILLGEIHDNADHHRVQARVIQRLVDRGRKPAIVMEMLEKLPISSIKTLNAMHALTPSENAFTSALKDFREWWKKSGWPAYETYAPIFDVVFQEKLFVAPFISGTNDPTITPDLLASAPLDARGQAALNEELKVSHCGVLPDKIIPKIAVAQRKRDIKLALAMVYASGDGTVLIAGSGHARKDRGVPHYLAYFGENSVTINFREVSVGKTEPRDLIEPGEADYIWFTPRHKREDPCIALRKRFGKKK